LGVFGRPRRRALPTTVEPMAAWQNWVANGMQQHERGLSPFDDSRPSALILVPLLGLPALLIVGVVLIFLLG
jgi:hypothetical protein